MSEDVRVGRDALVAAKQKLDRDFESLMHQLDTRCATIDQKEKEIRKREKELQHKQSDFKSFSKSVQKQAKRTQKMEAQIQSKLATEGGKHRNFFGILTNHAQI